MKIPSWLNDKNERKWIVSSIILIVFSLIVKQFADVWTVALLNKGAAPFLNSITGPTSAYSFDFYTGRMHELLWGPLEVLCSGFAFLLLSMRYLKDASPLRFGLAVFAYLLITKFEILFFPPYGDSGSGPVIEAIWLFHHNFDYVALSKETLFVRGGPKAYLFSLYPTYLAILMKLIPNTKLFLAVNHLIIFGLSALILSFFRSLARRIFNDKLSMLLSIFLLSLPLVQSQIEQINMEVPTLLFVMLSLFYLSEKKIFRSSIFSGLAVFTKLYAAYMGGAIFFVGVYLFFFGREQKKNFRVFGSGVLSMLFVILGTLALFYFMDLGGKVDKVGVFQGFALMKTFPISYFYLLSLVGFVAFAIQDLKGKEGSVLSRIVCFLNDHYRVAVMFVCSAGWFILFLNSGWIPPRYTFILLPSLILGIFYVICRLVENERVVERGIIALIFVGFLCSYGLPYPPVIIQDHAIVERSLEYRNDVMLHMKLARLIEQKYANLTVAAPFAITQFLAFPEMGFAHKKLDVMIYLFPCTYGGVKNFEGLEKIDSRKVVWVGVETPFMRGEHLPNGSYDHVIEELQVGNKSANLFVGGFSINAVYRQCQSMVKQLEEKGIQKLEL
ncbi:MAG: hypothetical protein PHY73_08390, partial [Candidatus Omnitrophica bacterium]|nr:hypothetical protein [Candidatus Omnitrophota bacterium]